MHRLRPSAWATCPPLLRPPPAAAAKSVLRRFHFEKEVWHPRALPEMEAEWRKGGRLLKEVRKRAELAQRQAAQGCEGPASLPTVYVLSQFPYPSGQLHMGHVRVYSISDALAHFHRLNGRRVIHPMGWDAFGLPAENAALERNVKPQDWTDLNIANMRRQLNELGCVFDWDRELSTCDPAYYRWTQYLFIKLLENNLAYQQEAMVNWDPVDKTVLADEQVDQEGRSWRSGAKVEKRPLRQWFLRTTNFAKSLYDELEQNEEGWRDIPKIQRNWIGQCNGTRFSFKLAGVADQRALKDPLTAWTGRPELIFGAKYVGLAEKHILDTPDLVQEEFDCPVLGCKVKRLNVVAENPFNDERLPVFVFSDTGHFAEESDTHIGMTDLNPVEKELCANLGLVQCDDAGIVDEAGLLRHSGQFFGLPLDKARAEILQYARERHFGGYETSSRLKDWLISRQRYWGTPIPVIHCASCGTVPVPADQLPVVLPDLPELAQKDMAASPLIQAEDWVNVDCPKCGASGAKRETDTMDTFVDSSWYFMRFLDPKNRDELLSASAASQLPVDVYIGGKEHATLHLFYARFVTHFLHQLGISPIKEPFQKLLVQGMVKGKSYRVKSSQRYLRPEEIDFSSSEPVEKETGLPLVVQWEKMSKSKYNGVDPNDIISTYGCDTTRWLMLCDVGPTSERKWSEDSYARIRDIQIRTLKLISMTIALQKSPPLPELPDGQLKKQRDQLWDARNYYVKTATHSYRLTCNLSIVIARVQSLLNDLWRAPGQVKRDTAEFQRALAHAVLLLTPVAPHFCAELWEGLCQMPLKHTEPGEFDWDETVFQQNWPQLDINYNLKLLIKINGDEKNPVQIPVARWKFATLTHEEAFDLACHDPLVQEKVLPREFSHNFSKVEDYEASLDFTVKIPPLSPEEHERLKKERKEEKMRKKERREKKIMEYKLAEERKHVRRLEETGGGQEKDTKQTAKNTKEDS